MPNYETDKEIKFRVDARHLKREFDQDNKLAPFECCWLWREAGLRIAELPEWVLLHLASIAAEYFDKRPIQILESDKRNSNLGAGPDFLLMTSRERKKLEPSLDKIAGLSGTKGQPSIWLWLAEHARDKYMAYFLDLLRQVADEGLNQWVLIYGERAGQTVPILRNQRLTDEVLTDIARLYTVGGWGRGTGWGHSKAKTVRQRLKRLEK